MNSPSDPVDGLFIRHGVAPLAPGPLDGLTFAVKDLIDLESTVTGCGNPTWAETHPPAAANAIVVEQLLRSGARCVGKTIADELAFSLVGENHFYGTPRNPLAPDRVPGGSSSGSASAVAAGDVDFSLGTDTAGSIRVPAANCGIFGLRPTWGAISTAGVQPLAPSFDVVGFFARDAAVLRQVARVFFPPQSGVPPLRRVLMLEQAWEIADPVICAVRGAAEDCFARAGLEVKSVNLDQLVSGEPGEDLFTWKTIFCGMQWPEIWSTHSAWLKAVAPPLGPEIARNFENVKNAGRSEYLASAMRRAGIRSRLSAILAGGVALGIPTTPSVAPLRGQVDYDRSGTGYLPRTICLTAIASLSGLPQLNLPFLTASGLPAGVSLVGGLHDDLALAEIASAML